MEYQYNIAGHLCRIVFCDAGNDSSLLPSFSPFESEEEGNLLFCLSVDDAFRWPVTGEEVGQFDCGGNNFGVYRLPDGSYQFEICDEKKALCCYLQANADFSDCTAALVAESEAGSRFGLNNALMLVYPGAGKHLVTAGCLRRWELLYSCGNVRKTRFGKRAYWKVLPRSCRPYRP